MFSTVGPTTTTTTMSAAMATTLENIVGGDGAAIVSNKIPLTTVQSTRANGDPAAHILTVDELGASLQRFGVVDYMVFVLMLVVCAAIGFYFGFIEKKNKKRNVKQRRGSEALDYLVGNRKMKVFPVSLSLVASFVSGISLLGTSTEIYVYGTQYSFILFTLIISGVISWYVFLPVFCNLQLTSTYEYLELRFDKRIRLLGSILFSIATIVWLPIVIYVPALAFNQVTGINIHVVTPIVSVVCIFYTCVGGLKAVVWTDVIQTLVMVGAVILVIVKGTADVGGVDVVWQRNWDSGRIEAPTMTWDPTTRVSMLSVFVGASLYFLQVSVGNQVIMQRYLSVSSLREARKACAFFTTGVIVLLSACFYNGLLIYATYHDCDPLTTKLAKAKDQLMPLLVMDILNVWPGMAGLFVAGVFSAALSSLSTGLNSLAAVFLEDYIKTMLTTPLTERQTGLIMRGSVLVTGIICVALVFVIERMGTVLQLTMTLGSITSGPLLGLFSIGLLLPWINAKSALTGSVVSFCAMAWICIKAQLAMLMGELVYAEKPVNTDGCAYNFQAPSVGANASSSEASGTDLPPYLRYIYHMTFMYYVAAGAVITVIVSGLASFYFGCNDLQAVDAALICPFVRRYLKPNEYACVQTEDQTTSVDIKMKQHPDK